MEKGVFEGNGELSGSLYPSLVMSRDSGLGQVYLLIVIFF